MTSCIRTAPMPAAARRRAAIAALPARVKPVADAVRAAGGWVISTHFTLVPGQTGRAVHLAASEGAAPVPAQGRFRARRFRPCARRRIAARRSLGREDRLFRLLHDAGWNGCCARPAINTLAFCGIVTNGGVASTLRDAHVRDFSCILLEDGCAAFSRRGARGQCRGAAFGRRCDDLRRFRRTRCRSADQTALLPRELLLQMRNEPAIGEHVEQECRQRLAWQSAAAGFVCDRAARKIDAAALSPGLISSVSAHTTTGRPRLSALR